MGGLATHPAWDAILKLVEWFGRENVVVRMTEDGSALITLPLCHARVEFLSDGSTRVRCCNPDREKKYVLYERAIWGRTLASLLSDLASYQESPSPFVQDIRVAAMRSVGAFPVVLPVKQDEADETYELLCLAKEKAVRITIHTRPDGSHGGKIQYGDWPDAMTIHCPTMTYGAVREALEAINV